MQSKDERLCTPAPFVQRLRKLAENFMTGLGKETRVKVGHITWKSDQVGLQGELQAAGNDSTSIASALAPDHQTTPAADENRIPRKSFPGMLLAVGKTKAIDESGNQDFASLTPQSWQRAGLLMPLLAPRPVRYRLQSISLRKTRSTSRWAA